MGYRGDDRSNERAAWGAQPPRQSSGDHSGYDDPGYEAAGYDAAGYDGGDAAGHQGPAGYDSSAGYDGNGQYSGGGYNGYGQDAYPPGGYATDGYDSSGSGGYPAPGYGDYPSGPPAAGGQAASGHRASGHPARDYGTAAGYNTAPTYDGQPGAGYRDPSSYDSGSYDSASYNAAPHNDGPSYDSGSYSTGSYSAGSYDTGSYGGGSPASAPHDTGSYSTGSYDTGSYGGGSYDGGAAHQGSGYADPSYDSADYQPGGYDTGSYSTGSHAATGYAAGGYGSTSQGGASQGSASQDSGGYDTGGYDTGSYDTGSYRSRHGSGAYPAVEPDSADDGNDWYARSGPIPASGFADTSSQLALRDPARDPVRGYQPDGDQPSPGMAVTTQQPAYDENKYAAYPGYGGVEETPKGYDDYDDYGSETRLDQAPVDFGGPQSARGYGQALQGDDFDGGYRGSRGGADEDVLTSPAGPVKGKKGKKKASAGGQPPRRSRRVLVISAVGVVLAAAVLGGGYLFLKSSKADNTAAQEASAPLPSSAPASATQQCVKQFGTYCHIEARTDDPAPLTLGNLYQPAVFDESTKTQFLLVADKLDKSCGSAVVGSQLSSQLKTGKCNQVLRASYVTDNNTMMGTIGVVNLSTTNQAHYAGRIVGASDFITPLASSKGVASKLGKGTGVVQSEYKGHYLILTWAEFTNLDTPKTQQQTQQLEAFESSLVASTANIYLSQLMIQGDSSSATPSASASSSPSAKASASASK